MLHYVRNKKLSKLSEESEENKMAELLESTMLICFGLSWPMNLAKNIKAKSAKNMSLQFILLIITGYIAGITAKSIPTDLIMYWQYIC